MNCENIKKFKNIFLIIDCCDNVKTRKIINDFSCENKKKWIYNGAIKNESMSKIFSHREKIFDKIFNNQKDFSCDGEGVLISSVNMCCNFTYIFLIKIFLKIDNKNLLKYDCIKNKIYEIKL